MAATCKISKAFVGNEPETQARDLQDGKVLNKNTHTKGDVCH